MKNIFIISLACLSLSFTFVSLQKSDWGFFGHKRINRLAVFTLPPALIGFYKQNIEYITDHAVDPDKRRYATKFEAIRHYIDLDEYGTYPFETLPKQFDNALLQHLEWEIRTNSLDTFSFKLPFSTEKSALIIKDNVLNEILSQDSLSLNMKRYKAIYFEQIKGLYYEEEWLVNVDILDHLFGIQSNIKINSIKIKDQFSEHGILPYHLENMLFRLTEAFKNQDIPRILQLSADYGHYIGDAHVPLHTTKNYNGQLTDQLGIHAFWESRLPELFADSDYDFFVGNARYIESPKAYFWNIVLDSHLLVDSVLNIEKNLSQTFPKDQQYCYEKRGDYLNKMPCKAYADAFHKALNGMVEDRMRASILSIGDVWYTAWVDAGKPVLENIKAAIQAPKASLERNESLNNRKHEF